MKYSSLILLALYLFCNNLTAQNTDLDTISYSINIDDVVITSQHIPTEAKNSVHLVNVIKKEEIQQKGFTQLDQVLTQLSSIRLNNDPILGSSARMRGVGSDNIAVLIDGVPVIGRLDGGLDLSQISMSNIEQIEIIEGPQSIIYGNNAAGGVINLITKKSQIDPLILDLTTNWEYPLIQNHGLNAGVKAKDFIFNFGGNYLLDNPFETDSLRLYENVEINEETTIRRKVYPWNPKERINAYTSVRYLMDDQNSVSFKYSYMDEKVSNFGELRRPTFMPYAFDEFYLTNRSDYSLSYQGMIKDININTSLAINDFNRILIQERYEFEEEAFNQQFTNIDSSFFRAYFGKTTLSISPTDKISILGGVQINHEIGSGDKIIDNTQADSSKVKSLESAIFADFRYNLKNTKASAGARVTHHSIYGTQFSPSFQVQHKFHEEWRIRAGYARGFRSPGLKELYINFIDVNHYVIGNRNLLPELTNDFNLSLAYEPTSKSKFNIKGLLKAYKTNISNKIILSEFEQLKFQYLNLNDYSVQGISANLDLQYQDFSLSNNFSLGYWYNQISEIKESPSFNQVIDNTATIGFEPKNKNYGLILVHRLLGDVPRYFIENDELKQTITKGYQFLDASVYTSLLGDKLKVNFGVRNIMDVVYADINQLDPGANHAIDTNINNQFVGRGRSYFISLSYNLSIASNNRL